MKLKGLALSACVLAMAGCAGVGNLPTVPTQLPLREGPPPEYVMQPGDNIDVKFFYSSDLNENVTIRPDGRISLQLVDDVTAAGLTPSELDDELTKLYTKKLPEKPDVSIIVKQFADNRIYVTGEVAEPGERALKSNMTAYQAIAASGGFRDTAGRDTVVIIRQDKDGNSAVMKADLSDSSLSSTDKSVEANVHLLPRDVVYVPKSGIAKADLFVDQHVRQLLLFNGISAGVSGVYELNDKDKIRAP